MNPNRLAREMSPYLLQHAHNPVDWYPWGEEAFAKARAEDKPVFLSIGYSTCHWCHVMERESFENAEIAALLNRSFVSIKLDREERPDIDRVYMTFVQATTGGGGWPMSVWLTPDRKPFYGGTYFPPTDRYGRPGFATVLTQIAAAWQTQRARLLASGESILEQLRRHTQFHPGAGAPDPRSLESCFHAFQRTYDSRRGGFGGAPKFPRPSVFNFLLRYSQYTADPEASQEARAMSFGTLRAMAAGGMYDHLGGGFHRYSVDEAWFVPHFEKMLYDQAQLAISYIEAFQLTADPQFAAVARGILDYVLRDLTHPEGGFFSAEDADSIADPARPSEKGEGAFYIWSAAELSEILGAAAPWVMYRYGATEGGNVVQDPHGEFTGRNILYLANSVGATAEHFGMTERDMAAALEQAAARLLAARARRPRPHLDDKILTSWNGLMISAFARAAFVLDDSRYRLAAERAARFVKTRLVEPVSGGLLRRWRDGEAAIDAFLDDYAMFGQALIDLYEATFDSAWLVEASSLTETMRRQFEDRSGGGFFSASRSSSDLVLHLKEDYDGAEPSGNSVAALNLLRLAQYTGNDDLRAAALRLFEAFASRLANQAGTLPQMAVAFLFELAPKSQVILAGNPGPFLPELRQRFRPHSITISLASDSDRARFASWLPVTAAMNPVDGAAAAYVCEDFTCRLPVMTSTELAAQLRPAGSPAGIGAGHSA